jgi:hypothetical protein
MKNKKGAVELSINTIVILFLALAMLGVGMFMINKLREGFNTVKLKDLNKDMVNLMYEKLQTGPEKLQLDTYEITVKKGAMDELYYGIKNVEDNAEDNTGQVFSIEINCPLAIGNPAVPPDQGKNYFNTSTELQYFDHLMPLKTSETAVEKIIIQPSSSKTTTTYSCLMTVKRNDNTVYETAKFSITVI